MIKKGKRKALLRVFSCFLSAVAVFGGLLPYLFGIEKAVALGSASDFDGEDYMSGTDFSELELGAVIPSSGESVQIKKDGKTHYNIVVKKSNITVLEEQGNKFLRVSKTPNNSSNDPYVDFIDFQAGVYTGPFVIQYNIRLQDISFNSTVNLMQVIDRKSGSSTVFSNVLILAKDGKSVLTQGSADTGADLQKGQWHSLAVAVHRNGSGSKFDFYLDGVQIGTDYSMKAISYISQIRVMQMPGTDSGTGTADIDNVWIYKGDKPKFVVGSGADSSLIEAELDYSASALQNGAQISSKLTTDKFELYPANDFFTVHKESYRDLLRLDHSRGEPYVDIFANGAQGSLVADMGIILGNDWKGELALLSPFAREGDYTSREYLLYLNASRQLVDSSGQVLATLEREFSRVAIAFSASRRIASVYLDGKLIKTLYFEYGSGLSSFDGVRVAEFGGCTDGGTVYISYAQLYRGTVPACLGSSEKLLYQNGFDSCAALSDISPMQSSGNVQLITVSNGKVLGYRETAEESYGLTLPLSESAEKLSAEFEFCAENAASVTLIGFLANGNSVWKALTADEDGRLVFNTADGEKKLFIPEAERYYTVALYSEGDGTFTLYIDGAPMVSKAAPSGDISGANALELISLSGKAGRSVCLDNIEIYSQASMYANALPLPIVPDAAASGGVIAITWDAIHGADGYRVYRAEAEAGEYSDISGLISRNSYTDGTAELGTQYFYKVKPVFESSDEEFFADIEELPVACAITDPGLGLQANGIANGIKLTWGTYSLQNSGYVVYRADEENGEYTAITGALSELSFTDTDVFTGLLTFYKVCVVIDKNGEPYHFGLDSPAVSAIAGAEEEEPPTDDEPPIEEEPPVGDGDGSGTDDTEGGFDIPSNGYESVFKTDFEKALSEIGGFAVSGTSDKASAQITENGSSGALRVSFGKDLTDTLFASVAHAADSKALIIDFEFSCKSLSGGALSFVTFEKAGQPTLEALRLESVNGISILRLGEGLTAQNGIILPVINAEQTYRVTVWFAPEGRTAAFFVDGVCVASDVSVAEGVTPEGSDGIRIFSSVSSAPTAPLSERGGAFTIPLSSGEERTEVIIDNVLINKTDISAKAYQSVSLLPKVKVEKDKNILSWQAAKGARYYTVWRSDASGNYTVIADKLNSTEYTDEYTGNCSYKVTYSYDTLGVVLSSLLPATGVTADKSVLNAVVANIPKFIDFGKAGTVGVIVMGLLGLGSIVALGTVKRRIGVDCIPVVEKKKPKS